MTNSQNTMCNNIYFKIEAVTNYFDKAPDTKDDKLWFVTDFEESFDEKNLFT